MPNENQIEEFKKHICTIETYKNTLNVLQKTKPKNSKEMRIKATKIKTLQKKIENAQDTRQNLLINLSNDSNVKKLSEIIEKFDKNALEVNTSKQTVNSRISFLEKRLSKLNKNQKKMEHPKRYFWVSKQKLNEKNRKILTEINIIPSYQQLDLLSSTTPMPTVIGYIKKTLEKEKDSLEAKDVVQMEYKKNLPYFNHILDQYVIGKTTSEEIEEKIDAFSKMFSSIEYVDQLIYTNFPAAKKLIENALERSQLTNQPVEARNVRLLKEKTLTSSAIQTTNENKEMQDSTSNNSQIDANLDSNNLSQKTPTSSAVQSTNENKEMQDSTSDNTQINANLDSNNLSQKTPTSSAVQSTNENKEMQDSTSDNTQINANLDSNNLSQTMLPQNKHITTTPEKSFVQITDTLDSFNINLTFTKNISVDNKLDSILSEDNNGRTDMIHVNNFHELTENITASDIDSEHSVASNSNKKNIEEILSTPLSEIPEENNFNHLSVDRKRSEIKILNMNIPANELKELNTLLSKRPEENNFNHLSADRKRSETKILNVNIPANELKELNTTVSNDTNRQEVNPKKGCPTTHEL
ncbi:hypothetical protein LQ060_12990 [Enterococcus faecium]|uniref:hypothetical protein n=1 Tax=Enterococcus faecium TaxID=1352 RepID=UPI002018A84B|nr:hypothetical protein [Enterococcus faecium]UQQ77711.1 hypothetical protein LQ060_12990 [Enterococcus faecium]